MFIALFSFFGRLGPIAELTSSWLMLPIALRYRPYAVREPATMTADSPTHTQPRMRQPRRRGAGCGSASSTYSMYIGLLFIGSVSGGARPAFRGSVGLVCSA